MNIIWNGSSSNCVYEGTVSGCLYFGNDQTWYNSGVCGASWCRPIFNGDNPLSTSLVSSCSYQTGSNNILVILSNNNNSYIYFDGFEFVGLCTNDVADACNNAGCSDYILDDGTGVSGLGMMIKNNLYFHGWTATTAIPKSNAIPCTAMAGGGRSAYVQIVVDGSDSGPGFCNAIIFPTIVHMKDSIFRYTQNIVGTCHDIHDVIFEHFYDHYFTGTHDNALECNGEIEGSTPNVYYNNIMRHFDPSFGQGGEVDLWFCPNTAPEYWFNNLMFDLNPVANQGSWNYAGPPTYPDCTGTGGQYMFNNTLVDTLQPCNVPTVSHGGQYLTVLNEHLIGTPFDSGTTPCAGLDDSSNVSMSDATATSEGYTTGSSGTSMSGNTCANDSTTPCSPTSPSNATVLAGANHTAYCTTLASYGSENAIGTEAANACEFGTTDGCAYNTSTHTMICPAQTAVARPPTLAWNAGAYQFSSSGAQPPPLQSPTNLTATVH
jgi:hypothetical protein